MPSHRAHRPTAATRRGGRRRRLLVAALAAVALLAVGFAITGRHLPEPAAGAPAQARTVSDHAVTTGCPLRLATAGAPCRQLWPDAGQAALLLRGHPAGKSRHHRRRAERSHARRPAATPAPTRPGTPAPSSTPKPSPGPGSPAPSQPGSAAASAVLAVINQARAQAGLPAYPVTSGLVASATGHNELMAHGCGLSHQCPGEPPLGTRETDAGVRWTAAGENIGEGGPEPATAGGLTQMAVTLARDMLAERAPDDGHRLNILSSTFRHVGIAVTIDGSGTVWMTQDFSN